MNIAPDELISNNIILELPSEIRNQEIVETKDSKPISTKPSSIFKSSFTVSGLTMFCVLCIIGSFFYVDSNNKIINRRMASNESPGQKYSNQLAMLSRIVNGISISQSIKSGSFDEKQLIDELFYLGSGYNLDQIAASKVSELANDLKSIQTDIEKYCDGDVGCGLSNEFMSGINGILTGSKDVLDVWSELSKKNIEEFRKSVKDIKTAVDNKAIKKLKEPLQKMVENIPEDNDKYQPDLLEAMVTIVQTFDSSDFLTVLKAKTFELSGAGSSKKSAIFNIFWNSIKTIKETSKAEKEKYDRLNRGFDGESIKQIKNSLVVFIEKQSVSSYEKNNTSGFPNGFEDVKKIMNDINDGWLKELLNPGKDLEQLSEMMSPLKSLNQKLEPLHSKWKDIGQSSDVASLRKVHLTLKALISVLKLTSASGDCIDKLDLNNTVFEENERIFNTVMSIAEGFNNCDELVTTFEKIKTIYWETRNTPQNMLPNVRPLKVKIVSSINSLTHIESKIKNVTSDEVDKLLTSEYSDSLSALKKWFDDDKSIQCLKNAMIPIGNYSMLATILPSSTNEDFKTSLKNFDALESSIGEYTTIIESLDHKSNQYSREADFELKNAEKVSKILGDISYTVHNQINIKESEPDVRELINSKAVINEVINKVGNEKDKELMKSIWHEDISGYLYDIIHRSHFVMFELLQMPPVRTVQGFLKPLMHSARTKSFNIDILQLSLIIEEKTLNKTLLNQFSKMEKLNFRYVTQDENAITDVINQLQIYFDTLFDVKRCGFGLCTVPLPCYKDPYFWIMLSMFLGFLSCIAFIFYLLYKPDKKKKKTTMIEKP